ncbi:hypothetical protein [Bradyrhizobium sp. SZCCHNRI2007]|uniref:hypothetical protein n=1 Tax=Bradyrhizobium sp. SZCCHNRI2007 TaxID=3057281 RepID=UPI0028EAE4B9|nr:hypothetical protein [Bradyrhizobium sp. SZCCHNRI2007]
MTELQEILYFDELSIQDLSNQVGHGKLETFSAENQKSSDRSSGIKPKLGLGHIVRALGGPTIDIDADINLKRGKFEKWTENFVATRQDHYRRVIDALGGSKQLRLRLDRAWHLALAKGGSVFCIVEEDFRPFHTTTDRDGWREAANDIQFLQLVDEPTRLYRVGMSFDKMVGIRDGLISPAGHLAVRLRGGSISLSIFGKMDKTRYIKPLVISWR